MAIWPWPPRGDLIELNEWLTDVIRTKNLEQRFSQRQSPRQSYLFNHIFTEDQYQGARALIRQNTSIQIPDWTLAVDIGAIVVDSAPLVNYGEPGVYIGDQMIVWQSNTRYESVTVIDTDSGNGLYLDGLTDDYENAKLIPLRNAQAPGGLIGSRRAGAFIDCQIQFDLVGSRDIGQSSYSRYRGEDVISECPVVASETFGESITWPFDTVDSGVGYPDLVATRSAPDSETVMRWHVFTREDLYVLRRFIHSRRGRWKQFWLSSFKPDFTLAQQIGASDGFIVVYAPGGITDLGVLSFDIEISGMYYRRVTSYTSGFDSNERPTLTLNIDSVVGATISTDKRISILRHMRFNSDRVEFNHQFNTETRLSASVAIPCLELPQ